MQDLTLILGGARSGKSEHAGRMAEALGGPVLYVATAQPLDADMRRRIAAHQKRRPAAWQTMELPSHVGVQLLEHAPNVDVVLLDCLTLLVSNRLVEAAGDPDHPNEGAVKAAIDEEMDGLVKAIDEIPAHWLVVSNEVGQGIVPAYPLGRLYRDGLGWANQRLAQIASEVIWMVAGIPVPIGQYRRRDNPVQ